MAMTHVIQPKSLHYDDHGHGLYWSVNSSFPSGTIKVFRGTVFIIINKTVSGRIGVLAVRSILSLGDTLPEVLGGRKVFIRKQHCHLLGCDQLFLRLLKVPATAVLNAVRQTNDFHSLTRIKTIHIRIVYTNGGTAYKKTYHKYVFYCEKVYWI